MEKGNISTPQEFKQLCEKLIDPKMKYCPGLQLEQYEEYKEIIRYDVKSVKFTDMPVKRIASTRCLMWFPLGRRGVKKEKEGESEVLCSECVRLRGYLRTTAQRLSSVSPEEKVRRQQADSFFPMKYLSPESLKRRKTNIKCTQIKERRLLRKHVPEDITLDDRQHAEMCQIQSSIDTVASSELESVFAEGEGQGAHTVIREMFVLKKVSYARLCTKIKCAKNFIPV